MIMSIIRSSRNPRLTTSECAVISSTKKHQKKKNRIAYCVLRTETENIFDWCCVCSDGGWLVAMVLFTKPINENKNTVETPYVFLFSVFFSARHPGQKRRPYSPDPWAPDPTILISIAWDDRDEMPGNSVPWKCQATEWGGISLPNAGVGAVSRTRLFYGCSYRYHLSGDNSRDRHIKGSTAPLPRSFCG